MTTPNEKAGLLAYLFVGGLTLAYSIYMLVYLNKAKKCDKYMVQRDQQFRRVAVVVTWIVVVLVSLSLVGTLIALIAGLSKPMSTDELLNANAMGFNFEE